MQNTLNTSISVTGVGLHSGRNITMSLHPACPHNGIVFLRSDILDRDNIIPAQWDRVVDTKLCTVVGNDDDVRIGTVEHVMAALRGCNIDNVVIELDGPEIPVMDGSAQPFVDLIYQAGIKPQFVPRRFIKVLKPITVQDGDKSASLTPANQSVFGGKIDFDHPEIGQQSYQTQLVNGNFVHELADSRTFGFMHEVEYLRSQGLALGGSLKNAIVLDRQKIMNTEGLRHSDEFIRHKLLDAVGDLYLAGAQIIGAYDGYKAGHDMNNRLLHALFSDDNAWIYVDSDHESPLIPQKHLPQGEPVIVA